MAYLGAIGTYDHISEISWSRYIIPSIFLGDIIGAFSTYGGYIYVG